MQFDNSVKVELDNELLGSMHLEGVLTSPKDPVGVAAFSEKNDRIHILRLYFLMKHTNTYKASHEIEAYSFTSHEELNTFLQRLPQMSAIELLILMNPPNIPIHSMLN